MKFKLLYLFKIFYGVINCPVLTEFLFTPLEEYDEGLFWAMCNGKIMGYAGTGGRGKAKFQSQPTTHDFQIPFYITSNRRVGV